MRSHRLGAGKALGLVNRRPEGQRHDRSKPRRRHQSTAQLVAADLVQLGSADVQGMRVARREGSSAERVDGWCNILPIRRPSPCCSSIAPPGERGFAFGFAPLLLLLVLSGELLAIRFWERLRLD
jgi:hypothetical protein